MIDAWNDRFAIEDRLVFEFGEGGLSRVRVRTETCQGEVYLHGAHVTGWQPTGHAPVLWVSSRAEFGPEAAIRGGIPICWPWFAAHPSYPEMPFHGFVRRREFAVDSTFTTDDGVGIVLAFEAGGGETRDLWPHPSRLECTIRMGRELDVDLRMVNESVGPLTFTSALHTYLAVGQAERVGIEGLTGSDYLDKPDGFRRKTQADPPRIVGEVDRVFVNTAAEVVVVDPVADRRLRVRKRGSETTVLWNPGPDRARVMADFDDDGYSSMLCVEAANTAEDVIELAPNSEHILGTTISVAGAVM